MAAYGKTGANLTSAVGYKLGITPSTTTRPTTAEIGQWLNDGQYELVRHLHPLLMPELVIEYSPTTASAAVKTNQPADFLKDISAYNSDSGEPCKLISYAELSEIKSGVNSYLSTESYVYTSGYDGSNASWFFYPSSDPTNMNFIYIKYPTAIANPPSTETFSLKLEFVPYVVDYAVIQAKTQDEEIQTQQALLKVWYERLEMLNKRVL